MNSHGNLTKTGIDFPLKSRQNLLITNEHLIMPRKHTLQQRRAMDKPSRGACRKRNSIDRVAG